MLFILVSAAIIWFICCAVHISRHIVVRCPMCNRKYEYSKINVMKQINSHSLDQMASDTKYICNSKEAIYESDSQGSMVFKEWKQLGCGARMNAEFIMHPFVRKCLQSKAKIGMDLEQVTALTKALQEQEQT